MNTLLRRFFILAAVLLCCTAMANAYDAQIDGIYYNFDKANGTATVTSGGSEYEGDITIPAKVTYESKEYIVTSIGASAFYHNIALTSIIIPSGVTSIGDSAFYNCNKLATVTFAEGSKLESIGNFAFQNCIALTSITIPNSVTSIGESAFASSPLTSITIPSSVTSIGDGAFAGCNKLESVYVSWKVPLAISDNVFSGLSTFEITLHVPYGTLDAYRTANVWSTFNINDEAVHFADANAEAISIENWDSNHDGHLSYEEAAAVTDLEDAFSNSTITSLNELKYFKNLTSIGENAFSGCSMLKSINIPNSVTNIESGAFKGTSITSIEIPATITSIGESAFENCTNLKAVTIPATVTSIGESAFENCTNLKSITIPATVTSIGESAFKGCSGLEEIYVKAQSPLSITSNVFENVATTCLLRVPYGSVLSYKEADVWKNFTNNIQDNAIQFEDPEVKTICLANWDTNEDGVLTYEEAAAVRDLNSVFKNNTTITSFNELKYFTGLKEIGLFAFRGCTGLTSVTIPNSVTSIEYGAFDGCTNLVSITIPNSVAYIEKNAFYGCTNLVSITIPNSVAYIKNYAFDGCTNLQNIGINIADFANNNIIYDYFGTSKTIKYYYNGEEISGELTIPSTTTSIGNKAFKGVSGLTSVTIPSSVTAIGNYAFSGCTGLDTVSVQWTEADKIPDISGKNVFNGIALSDVTLDIPYKKGGIRSLYTAKDVWKNFNIDLAKNFAITKSGNTTIEEKVSENSDIVIDESGNDIKNISVYDNVPSVKSITYTRDFTNVAGKWQTWFVPFEVPVSALNNAELDVAEVGGILFDKDKNAVVAFNMMDGGTMKANTPYVVRLKADATNKAPALVFENANLKTTEETSFTDLSSYDKFTFTGNYESKHVDDSYTLNKDGEFMKMGAAVSLKPMRFSLSVSQRDDSPYTQQTSPMPVIRYMVLGDDGTLQPIDEDGRTGIKPATTPANSFRRSQQPMRIYDLHGRKVNRIQSKQVYIIDGKTYTAR